MRKISKGNVTIKLWDIGGQPRSIFIIGDDDDTSKAPIIVSEMMLLW